MAQIELAIKLRKEQLIMWRALARFNVLVCHRRLGKTYFSIARLVERAIGNERKQPHPNYAYIAPTYKQAKRIAFAYLVEFTAHLPGAIVNKSELMVTLHNGAVIRLLGAEDADSLRGIYLDGLVIDETALISSDAWNLVLRPTLIDFKGWAIFIGTPSGRLNLFYDQFNLAEIESDYYNCMWKASQTNIIPPDELALMARTLRPAEYEQEIECSWDAAVMGAYFTAEMRKLMKEQRCAPVGYDPQWPVYAGLDIGYGDLMVWVIYQHPGNRINIIDVKAFQQTAIPDQVRDIKGLPYAIDGLLLPHDANQHSIGTGLTRERVFQNLGYNTAVVKRHLLPDGIEMVRNLLPNVHIDQDKGKVLVEALLAYRADYDPVKRVNKTTPIHDWSSHYVDAFRMIAAGASLMQSSGTLNYERSNRARI